MDPLVEVTISVEAEAAAELTNPQKRAAAGRMISRVFARMPDPLLAAIDRLGEEAGRRGLTQEMLDEELAVYNGERRGGNDQAV